MKKAPIILINSFLLNAHPLIIILKFLVFNTGARFSSITCEVNDILKIIRNLNISKAYGFDDTLIKMVKLCDDSLVKPLSIIFQNCTISGVVPVSWEKSNIVPIHKTNDKQLINNHRLSPFCQSVVKCLKEFF